MPSIYQARCSNCGHESPWELTYSLALRTTSKGGPDHFEILLHPGERRTLEKRGIHYEQAVADERLVRARRVVCDGCGHIHTQYIADLQDVWPAVKRTGTPKKLPVLSSCERCGGTEFRRIESREPVICPACGVRAFSFQLVGIS
jgi:hypothetical protein